MRSDAPRECHAWAESDAELNGNGGRRANRADLRLVVSCLAGVQAVRST